MMQPALAILGIAGLTFVAWSSAGLWIDVLLLSSLWQSRTRAFLLPIIGAAFHMILLSNLSYLGLPGKVGVFITVGVGVLAAVVLLLIPRHRKNFLTPRHLVWPALVMCLALAVQTAPLIKTGSLTTIGLENTDWVTYVSHADWLRDHSYSYRPPPEARNDSYNFLAMYQNEQLRIGTSQLFAGFCTLNHKRGIYVFNIFAGLIVGLTALSFIALLSISVGLSLRHSVAGGCVFAISPLLHWISFAAFLPQLMGMTLAMLVVAILPGVMVGHAQLKLIVLTSLLLSALLLSYNEILPLVVAAAFGSFLQAMPSRQAVLQSIQSALLLVGISFLFSPVGFLHAAYALPRQSHNAKLIGGGVQALRPLGFYLGTILGFLPPPPLPAGLPAAVASPLFPLYSIEVLVVLLIACVGFAASKGTARWSIGSYLIGALPIGAFIWFADSVYRLKTWNTYKLTQYCFPVFIALVIAGAVRLWTYRRWRLTIGIVGAILVAHTAATSGAMVRSMPRMPLTQDYPRYFCSLTKSDDEFVRRAELLGAIDEPFISLNTSATIAPGTSLLAYPHPVIPAEMVQSLTKHGTYTYLVRDRLQPADFLTGGRVIWRNPRFTVVEAADDTMVLTGRQQLVGTLSPASHIFLPFVNVGGSLVLHVYSPQAQAITIRDSVGGETAFRGDVCGESVIIVSSSSKQMVARNLTFEMRHEMILLGAKVVYSPTEVTRFHSIAADMTRHESRCAPVELGPWTMSVFDGAVKPPLLHVSGNQVAITSGVPTSGAATTQVSLSGGWYLLTAALDARRPADGNGRGYGVGLLDRPETMWFTRRMGTVWLRRLIHVPSGGPRALGLVLGGFGLVTGDAVFKEISLVPLAGDDAVPAIKESLTVPTGSTVALKKGWYALESEFNASAPDGVAVRYRVSISIDPDLSWLVTKPGPQIIYQALYIDHTGAYKFPLSVENYRSAATSITFGTTRLTRILGPGVMPTFLERSTSLLSAFDTASWHAATYDASPKPLQIQTARDRVSVAAPTMGSGGLVSSVSLRRGWYLMSGDIDAAEPADGPGQGYGFGLVGNQAKMLFVRHPGLSKLARIVRVAADGQYAFGVVLGGWGTCTGRAAFENIRLVPLSLFWDLDGITDLPE